MIHKIELKLAILSKKIIETKWWQFRKRTKLYKEAAELAKKHDIDF